jgi:hypothetical protein
MGPVTSNGIAYSRNIVAARSARMLGKNVRRRPPACRVDRLGIGRKTGSNVRQVAGLVVDPATRQWAGIDLANQAARALPSTTQL